MMQHTGNAFQLLKKELQSLPPSAHAFHNGARLIRGRFRENASISVGLHPNKSIVKRPVALNHQHDFIEIVYVHKGVCYQRIENETLTCKEGSIVLLNERAFHTVWVDSDQDIVVNLGIKRDTVQRLLSSMSSRKTPNADLFGSALFGKRTGEQRNYLHIDNDLDIDGLISEMFCEYYHQNHLYEHVLLSDFMKLMIQLSRYHGDCGRKPEETEYDLANEILLYIQTHYMQLNMEALSMRFHYSQRQIRRLLRNVTDDSLPNMLNRLKIEKACEYISKSQMSTEEILERIHYCDANYFYKMFRSVMGMSVMEYRHGERGGCVEG